MFIYAVYCHVDTHICYYIGNMQYGETTLHCASSDGHHDIAQLLVQAGTNIDLQDEVSTYLMFINAVYRHVDSYICYHIRNMQDGVTALHCAIIYGHLDVVQLLVQEGARIDLQNKVIVYSEFTK